MPKTIKKPPIWNPPRCVSVDEALKIADGRKAFNDVMGKQYASKWDEWLGHLVMTGPDEELNQTLDQIAAAVFCEHGKKCIPRGADGLCSVCGSPPF